MQRNYRRNKGAKMSTNENYKMHLGVYVEHAGLTDQMTFAKELFDYGKEKKILKDKSIFYNSAMHNEVNIKCGMFNSTDIWNFSGTIVTFSLSNCLSVTNIINNFNVAYIYGLEEKLNVFNLLKISQEKNVKFMSSSPEKQKELFRITGVKNSIVNTAEDFFNEYK